MLSKILSASRSISNLSRAKLHNIMRNTNQFSQNVIPKRWSGHNTMEITPSNMPLKRLKDLIHFYTLLSLTPVIVITSIINIRANPELTEIPEGYEPRHWEYYRHPIARWLAKNLYVPMELEYEMNLSLYDDMSQTKITKSIMREVDKLMTFYQDHRSQHFRPYFAEYFRIGRDDSDWGVNFMTTNEAHHLENSYKVNVAPMEGYPPDFEYKD